MVSEETYAVGMALLSNHRQNIAQWEAHAQDLSRKIDRWHDHAKGLENKLEAANARAQELEKKLKASNAHAQAVGKDLNKWKVYAQALEKQRDQQKAFIAQQRTKLAQLSERIEFLESQLQKAKDWVDARNAEQQDLKEEVVAAFDRKDARISELKSALEQAEEGHAREQDELKAKYIDALNIIREMHPDSPALREIERQGLALVEAGVDTEVEPERPTDGAPQLA